MTRALERSEEDHARPLLEHLEDPHAQAQARASMCPELVKLHGVRDPGFASGSRSCTGHY